MTKEVILNLIKDLNDDQIEALCLGINQITCEYGWDADLDNTELIQRIWKNN